MGQKSCMQQTCKSEDETRFERVTYRTAAGCSTPELFVLDCAGREHAGENVGLWQEDNWPRPLCWFPFLRGFMFACLHACNIPTPVMLVI